jgi:hypothetical protein
MVHLSQRHCVVQDFCDACVIEKCVHDLCPRGKLYENRNLVWCCCHLDPRSYHIQQWWERRLFQRRRGLWGMHQIWPPQVSSSRRMS